MIKISPSILSADFVNLERDVKAVAEAGADLVHVDVMDGHFVPNITIGVPVVKSLKKISPIPLDVHLMIEDPLYYSKAFVDAGADILTFHLESESDTLATILMIKDLGCKVGLSIKPKTKAEDIFPYLKEIDMVLVMTVEPGFGGQSFMADMCPKIKAIKDEIKKQNLDVDIEVDGGINPETAKLVKEAGANILVAGSAIYGKPNYKEQIELIRNA